ncbi:MAG: fibronectin type III domain-containing protein [Flavobacterium sp.]|uniref:DUF7619 domain-containing protein n=1 Tax=Flavobacterium sp. TaxID=239 RepID=UPI00326324A7
MKKLLLLLLFTISANAQFQTSYPTISQCDDNSNDQHAVFDLTPLTSQILVSVNPSDYTVSFHSSFLDATNNTNLITPINSYINTSPAIQTIGIRIVNNSTSEVSLATVDIRVLPLPTAIISSNDSSGCQNSGDLAITITGTPSSVVTISNSIGTLNTVIVSNFGISTFSVPQSIPGTYVYSLVDVHIGGCSQNLSDSVVITVNPAPIANPATLSFCDMTELAIYGLSNADAQITGGAPASIVTYYETLADAQTGANAIPDGGYIPLINPGQQILYASVFNPASSCSSITTLTLNTHNCDACQAPSSLVNTNITSNSAVLTWVQPANPDASVATAWEIIALPTGSPAPTASSTGFINTTVNPYTITGLNPSTCYTLYVRSLCSPTVKSNWSIGTSFCMSVTPVVCGGNFADQGGVIANYSNNSNSTMTICPTNPGEAVTIVFTSFNTEIGQDALYVFDGTFIGDPQISSTNPAGNVPGGLAGGYWGSTIPGPFTSTSPNGCLTFMFRSDAANTLEGWNANVICTPVVCETPTGLAVTNITSTSAALSWSNPSGSSALEVIVFPQGSPSPTHASSGNFAQIMPYLVTGLSPDICYTAYVRSLCSISSEWSSPVDFCMFDCENNAECAESLVLIAFLDSNNNGLKDVGEIDFNYGNYVYHVNDSADSQYGGSNNGSYFIFDANPTNSYDISFAVVPDLATYYTSAASHNDVTLPTGSGSHFLYFPIVNILPHVDAQVYFYSVGQPRPGFTYINTIYYQNNGFQTITNGTLTFTKASNVSIASISQAGTTPTANGFTYDFTNLAPFEVRYIQLSLSVPTIPTVNLGDLVTNSVTVQIANDVNLTNNSSSITQTIVGSYDPNDKMESHGGKILHSTFTSNDYLYYTIQFENTGSASAEFIRVEDALNSQLDESTFEMVSASHNVNTKRVGNQLTWHFYNINLPPTISNPSGSHGYVSFKIKPKPGYAIGDIIPNTASIYFDYNPAIVTNRFDTEFILALGNPTFNADTISLYPNPTSALVTISNSNAIDKISTVVIYEVSGKRIYTLNKNTLCNIDIDVSNFARGLYLVELTSENNTKITKKLLLK